MLAPKHFDATAFESAIDGVVRSPFRVSPPSILYHYTTWGGFEGIIGTQRIFCKAHHLTNDPAEFRAVDEIVRRVASKLAKSRSGLSRDLLLRFLRLSRLQAFADEFVGYLSCFSQARDKSSQWGRYAACGTGVCIGLRVLAELPPQPEPGTAREFFAVEYEPSAWRNRITAAFNRVCDHVDLVMTSDSFARLVVSANAGSAFQRIAALAAACAKTKEWAEEEEWRHVALIVRAKPPASLAGRSLPDRLELPFRSSPQLLSLAEIIIGPNQAKVPAEQSIADILRNAHYTPGSPEMPRVEFSNAKV